jgi:hypothetical protein
MGKPLYGGHSQWYHRTVKDTGPHYAVLKIEGSNSTEGLDVYLLCFLCVVEVAASVTSWSLIQTGPIRCASQIVRDLETSTMMQCRPDSGSFAPEKEVCHPRTWRSMPPTQQSHYLQTITFIMSSGIHSVLLCIYVRMHVIQQRHAINIKNELNQTFQNVSITRS